MDRVSVEKVLKDTVIDPNLVVDHNSGLKNRCSPSRFREIASGNLQLPGGSTTLRGKNPIRRNLRVSVRFDRFAYHQIVLSVPGVRITNRTPNSPSHSTGQLKFTEVRFGPLYFRGTTMADTRVTMARSARDGQSEDSEDSRIPRIPRIPDVLW